MIKIGQADNVIRNYFSNKEVQADFINSAIYNGDRVVLPEDIEEVDTVTSEPVPENTNSESNSPKDVAYDERRRDKLFRVKVNGRYYILIGDENQAVEDRLMPIRAAEYDIREYARQRQEYLTREKQRKKRNEEHKKKGEEEEKPEKFTLIPVVTIVIWWSPKPWTEPKDLKSLMDQDFLKSIKGTALDDMIKNYSMFVYEPRVQKDENLDKLKTGLGMIIGMVKYSNDTEKVDEYIKSHEKELEKTEVDVINAITKANLDYQKSDSREGGNMCGTALKELVEMKTAQGIKIGIEQGRQRGREEGRQQGAVGYALKLYNRHRIDEDELYEELLDIGLSDDEARELIEKQKSQNAPVMTNTVKRKPMKL